jgi:hypothetical protein
MFDSLGVGQTGGVTPGTVEGMARLRSKRHPGPAVPSPSTSLAGRSADSLPSCWRSSYPSVVRRLILAGTMPARWATRASLEPGLARAGECSSPDGRETRLPCCMRTVIAAGRPAGNR